MAIVAKALVEVANIKDTKGEAIRASPEVEAKAHTVEVSKEVEQPLHTVVSAVMLIIPLGMVAPS
jgi:F0F1-type ATP synthase alpha subunit